MTDKLIPVPKSVLTELQNTLNQAFDCIRGDQPEDISEEEARQDTLEKLREADRVLAGSDAFASLMPTGSADEWVCKHEPFEGFCLHCGVPFKLGRPAP